MPLYEFYCADCGREFEKMLRFDQAGEHPLCPTCASTETRKKMSIFSSGGQSGSAASSGSCGSSSGGFT